MKLIRKRSRRLEAQPFVAARRSSAKPDNFGRIKNPSQNPGREQSLLLSLYRRDLGFATSAAMIGPCLSATSHRPGQSRNWIAALW